MDLTGIVAVVGMFLLLLLAVGVGTELDTDRQRRARQQLADERRIRSDEQHDAHGRGGPLCERCPYRDRL